MKKYIALVSFCAVAMLFLDIRIATWVHGHVFSETTKVVLAIFRVPGNYIFTIVVAALLVLTKRCRVSATVVLAVAGAIASAAAAVLKLCFGRMRPYHGRAAFDWAPLACNPFDTMSTRNLSFPSGDATLAFATAAVFMFIEPRLAKYGYAWAVLVGVIRILQGAHYLSDVTAGAIVGIGCTELILRFDAPRKALGLVDPLQR